MLPSTSPPPSTAKRQRNSPWRQPQRRGDPQRGGSSSSSATMSRGLSSCGGWEQFVYEYAPHAVAVLIIMWAVSPFVPVLVPFGLGGGGGGGGFGGPGGAFNSYDYHRQQITVNVWSAKGHDAIARKQELNLLGATLLPQQEQQQQQDSNPQQLHQQLQPIVQILDAEQQRSFVRKHRCGIDRFDELVKRNQEHLATELWKYCAMMMSSTWSSSATGALYVDKSSPLLVEWPEILQRAAAKTTTSIAVLGDSRYFPETIHGSFLYLAPNDVRVAGDMLRLLQTTPVPALEASPLLLQRTLYRLIANATSSADSTLLQPGWNGGAPGGSYSRNQWFLLEQKCDGMDPLARIPGKLSSDSHRVFTCPAKSEFCCSVRSVVGDSGAEGSATSDSVVVMWNRHPLLPFQKIVEKMPRPYHASIIGSYSEDELPYMSTVREIVHERSSDEEEEKQTKNLYEIFLQHDILPKLKCRRCLNLRKCTTHELYCKDYMRNVCKYAKQVPKKFISKQLVIRPPLYRRDPSRLVPRILHQTWYETLSKEEYPNMSRLVESFVQSGWEYKFYSDADAERFLETHFPPEVLEAYKALIPGAFKADLFRYCALLIHGGVYADVDIMLESKLDLAIEPDIGFMVPMDEPEACVWQGFIAAAPGHPFLAKAIETVVNQVRNRFTSIDIDGTFCPTPNFKVLHMFDVLFTAGPCLLGASMNRVLGKHGQTLLEPGELVPENDSGASFVLVDNGNDGEGSSASSYSKIPGRTVILKQNKWDMSAHRFTMMENNLIVAATDLEHSDDRKNQKAKKEAEAAAKAEADSSDDEDEEGDEGKNGQDDDKKKETSSGGGGEHYSKAHAKSEIYGLQGLYSDLGTEDEEIRIVVDASRQWRMMSSIESPTTTTS